MPQTVPSTSSEVTGETWSFPGIPNLLPNPLRLQWGRAPDVGFPGQARAIGHSCLRWPSRRVWRHPFTQCSE